MNRPASSRITPAAPAGQGDEDHRQRRHVGRPGERPADPQAVRQHADRERAEQEPDVAEPIDEAELRRAEADLAGGEQHDDRQEHPAAEVDDRGGSGEVTQDPVVGDPPEALADPVEEPDPDRAGSTGAAPRARGDDGHRRDEIRDAVQAGRGRTAEDLQDRAADRRPDDLGGRLRQLEALVAGDQAVRASGASRRSCV